jgi:hypothetical protein
MTELRTYQMTEDDTDLACQHADRASSLTLQIGMLRVSVRRREEELRVSVRRREEELLAALKQAEEQLAALTAQLHERYVPDDAPACELHLPQGEFAPIHQFKEGALHHGNRDSCNYQSDE